MDLFTGVILVHSATDCVCELRSETVFTELWNIATNNSTTPQPSKRMRTMNRNLQEYVIEESVGQSDKTGTLFQCNLCSVRRDGRLLQ